MRTERQIKEEIERLRDLYHDPNFDNLKLHEVKSRIELLEWVLEGG